MEVQIVDGELKPVTPVNFKIVDKNTRAARRRRPWSIDRAARSASWSSARASSPRTETSRVPATVTAQYGANQATSKVTIKISATSNGANAKSGIGPDGQPPKGGFKRRRRRGARPGAVGPDQDEAGDRQSVATSKFEMLAVRPKRSIRAPFSRRSSSGEPTSTSKDIRSSEAERLRFRDVRAAAGHEVPERADRRRIWKRLLNSNQEIRSPSRSRSPTGTTTYGPIVQTWTIAPGILRGTVYYKQLRHAPRRHHPGNKAAPSSGSGPCQAGAGAGDPGRGQEVARYATVSANGNPPFSNDADQDDGDYGYAART